MRLDQLDSRHETRRDVIAAGFPADKVTGLRWSGYLPRWRLTAVVLTNHLLVGLWCGIVLVCMVDVGMCCVCTPYRLLCMDMSG